MFALFTLWCSYPTRFIVIHRLIVGWLVVSLDLFISYFSSHGLVLVHWFLIYSTC